MQLDEPYTFKTKAQTLVHLQNRLDCAVIPNLYVFSVKDWTEDRAGCLYFIDRHFRNFIVVRSSTTFEDNQVSSGAGEFDSILNVDPKDQVAITDAVDQVIEAYSKKITSDYLLGQEILIQDMIDNVSMSGVVFTCEVKTGSPYYVINYDDVTGRTDTVTAGEGEYSNRTLYVYKDSISSLRSRRFQNLLAAIIELETKLNRTDLDIEFASDTQDLIYILQVRPIIGCTEFPDGFDSRLREKLGDLSADLEQRFSRTPGVFGETTVFGQMPDWNPAELLGRVPRPLAISLYEQLITEGVWSRAREMMGYSVPQAQSLMSIFTGQPFIDVRLSFNSFLPQGLPNDLCETLIDHWISELIKKPEKHDKVEFDIAVTAFTFDIDTRVEELIGQALSTDEKVIFKKYLRTLTKNLIDGCGEGSIGAALKKIQILKSNNDLRDIKNLRLEDLNKFVSEIIEYGTVPFAILARHAFIASTMLASLRRENLGTATEIQNFQSSIITVASELVADMSKVSEGSLKNADFFETYGHLRPGTYDILSLRYDQLENFFTEKKKLSAVHVDREPICAFSDGSLKKIDLALEDIGWDDLNSDSLLNYCSEAIRAREYSKFVFTKSVSDMLESIANQGASIGLSREILSFLRVDEVILDNRELISKKDELISIYRNRWMEHELNAAIRLPMILHDAEGAYVIPFQVSQPNFVTNNSVQAEIVFLTNDSLKKDISGKIVLIENADPGFDWIFARGISGLITKYGGVNSHMAIRCAEFNIPAAIGCGEQRYEILRQLGELEIDCERGVLRAAHGALSW